MAGPKKHSSDQELFNISQFVESWNLILDESELHKTEGVTFEDYLKNKMDIDEGMVLELDAVCGIDTLQCDGEVVDRNIEVRHRFLKEIPKNLPLLSTEFQRLELKKREEEPQRKMRITKSRTKISRFREAQFLHMLKQTDETYSDNITLPEAVINIRIYYPYQPKSQLKVFEEIQVLGSQGLCVLRDKINCLADTVVVGEFSENPNLPQDIISGDLYKSGFFFIENTFYNDTRDPDCRDYSALIQKWSQEKNRGLGPYTSAKMEDVRFSDLSVKLGYPYLYMHQGDCEHILVFSDIRMLHREDCWDSIYYPMVVGRSSSRRISCRACQLNVSTWMVRNSVNAPEDPCYLCDSCFKSFHYTDTGEKLGVFDAYPYPNGGIPWT